MAHIPLQPVQTYYAPPERLPAAALQEQVESLEQLLPARVLFDAIPEVLLILNPQRQIVFANSALSGLAGSDSLEDAMGRRPGEVIDCLHSKVMEAGCGTSQFCQVCGAARSVVNGLDGVENVQECRISLRSGEALDLRVWSTPLQVGNETFVFLVLKDISGEKRRQMLEHVFFHDILNSAGALHGMADLLVRAPLDEKNEVADDISQVSSRLIEEIQSQKMLIAAETGDLYVEKTMISVRKFLDDLVAMYEGQEVAAGVTIKLDREQCDLELSSDSALLHRILGNMIKNALEASHRGEVVTVGCLQKDGHATFWVHNPGVIPPDDQLQIFQRSFSTKGRGRGLGTYSIRLLGEAYLGGAVSFTSTQRTGTTFRIELPLEA